MAFLRKCHSGASMPSLAGLPCNSADREACWLEWRRGSLVFNCSYLGVYYEDLAHRNPNLEVTKFICISIPKSSIERMRVRRKQCFDSLCGTVYQYILLFPKSTNNEFKLFFLLDFLCGTVCVCTTKLLTPRHEILNSWGALLITATQCQKTTSEYSNPQKKTSEHSNWS